MYCTTTCAVVCSSVCSYACVRVRLRICLSACMRVTEMCHRLSYRHRHPLLLAEWKCALIEIAHCL